MLVPCKKVYKDNKLLTKMLGYKVPKIVSSNFQGKYVFSKQQRLIVWADTLLILIHTLICFQAASEKRLFNNTFKVMYLEIKTKTLFLFLVLLEKTLLHI